GGKRRIRPADVKARSRANTARRGGSADSSWTVLLVLALLWLKTIRHDDPSDHTRARRHCPLDSPDDPQSRRQPAGLGRGKNPLGLQEYLVVHGRARITEGGAPILLQRLAHLYFGPDAVFPPASLRDQPGYITRITPERFGGI